MRIVLCAWCHHGFCVQVRPSPEWSRLGYSEEDYDGPALIQVLQHLPQDVVPMEGSCLSMADRSHLRRPQPPQPLPPGSEPQSDEANEVIPLQNAPPQEQAAGRELQSKAASQAQ